MAKTLQQLIEKINTEAKGTVVDLAGRSYKPAKGWFSALSNLSRLSSTPTLSSRASVPIPFPNDDNSDMMIAPEDMQLYQTPINDSEPGFDARAIFQLQMIQDPARRSQGASKLLHVASAHTTLVNGKLYLPAGGQLVLGPECQQLCFQDVTIKGVTVTNLAAKLCRIRLIQSTPSRLNINLCRWYHSLPWEGLQGSIHELYSGSYPGYSCRRCFRVNQRPAPAGPGHGTSNNVMYTAQHHCCVCIWRRHAGLFERSID